jgi:HEPN domain-containing protein
MDNRKEALKWFELANNDFEAATILSKQLKPKYEIVCYHCQQCAEKMLKGFIALNGGRLQKTHDLTVLCELCFNFDPDFEKILNYCSDLTVYSSEVRYPDFLEIEDYHMRKAVEDVFFIMDFIMKRSDLKI